MKRISRGTTLFLGVAVAVGFIVVHSADAVHAQCGYGLPYYAAPHRPPVPYWYRVPAPSYGCYPAYGPPVYVYRYVVPQVTPRAGVAAYGVYHPTESGWAARFDGRPARR